MRDHITLRPRQRPPLARILRAALLALALTWMFWRLGRVALMVGMFIASGVVVYALLTIAPNVIAHWRGHHWRWWRRRNGEGPFWAGTREPRHPRRPL
ncbi:MAG: hypothetical protein ACRDHE_14010, partial [Ktedonobacterales bacterium]